MTGRVVPLEPDPHVAVQALLPWYVTGRLAPAEAAQLDAHLPGCAECRAELAAERQWQGLQVAAVAQVDVEEGWAAMRARLAEPHPGDRVPPSARPAPLRAVGDRGRRPAGWSSAGPLLRWGWTIPTALAAVLLAGVSLREPAAPGSLVAAATPDYHALASAAPVVGQAVVRFRPDATEAQVRAALQRCEGRLVDGPTVSAAWVVSLPREHYAQALALLRQQPGVALVEALEVEAPR